MTAPLPCPSWCDRKHLAGRTAHHLDVGTVTDDGSVITVDVHRDSDDAPTVVAVNFTDNGIDLSVKAANLLAAVLADAVQLAGNDPAEVTR